MSRKADRKLWDSLLTGLADSLIITLQIRCTLQGCVVAGYKKKSRTFLTLSVKSSLVFHNNVELNLTLLTPSSQVNTSFLQSSS